MEPADSEGKLSLEVWDGQGPITLVGVRAC